MNIKVGDHIGIGSNKTTSLFCTVERIDHDGNITFHVINGAWTGVLHTDGTITIGNKPTFGPKYSEVLYVFKPNELKNMHYNDALYYMDEQLRKRFRIRTYVNWKWYTIVLYINRFRQWLSDIISPTSNRRNKYDPWDDDIPF